MTHEQHDLPSRLKMHLERLASEDASSARIAEDAATTWRKVHATLAPILGTRGVSALFGRTLHLTRAAHPFLADLHEGAPQPGEYGGLRAALSKQSSEAALAAHGVLLHTFFDLLTSLIGGVLVERFFARFEDRAAGGEPLDGASPS